MIIYTTFKNGGRKIKIIKNSNLYNTDDFIIDFVD